MVRGPTVARQLAPLSGTFPQILRHVEPLSAPAFRRLWVGTASERWRTAYFDGFINGGDAFPPVSYLAARLGCYGLVVSSQPDSPHCFGANKLELYGPTNTNWLNLVWCVSAVNDGGRWKWYRNGPEQTFEETAAYSQRRIKDRFTPEMLRRYCAAIQVPLDASEYGADAMLDAPQDVASTQRQETLREARARYGLEG